jgi:uncharacterized membrane protein
VNKKVYTLAEISLLAAFIVISGSFKIPTGIPGSEFQLSAPVAIAICAVFGFKKYLMAGMLSSCILFMLGLHTLFNIEIAMVYRIVSGGIIAIFGARLPALVFAGPIGTLAARKTLALTLQIPALPLIIPAIPGMVFTALTSYPLMKVIQNVYQQTRRKQHERLV